MGRHELTEQWPSSQSSVQLMNVHNLPVLDLRHTLPNLNNLMLTLSSPVALEDTPSGPPAAQNRPLTSTALSKSSGGGRVVSQAMSSVRRGYRTTGKGEIVLPILPTSATTKDNGTNGIDSAADGKGQGSTNVHEARNGNLAAIDGGSSDTGGRSAAASWTASLLGWSGGKPGGRGEAQGQAAPARASAQNGKAPNSPVGRRVTSDGAAARADG